MNHQKEEEQLTLLINNLIDPQAKKLSKKVEWWDLKELTSCQNTRYPVAVTGKGPTILLLHGFDSCFLEFRRLAPLLEVENKLIIPDLHGFGFCPRPINAQYNSETLILHIKAIINNLPKESLPIGIIGASMGGALAISIARALPAQINKLLLLSPAGLTGPQRKVPWPLNHIGACFLRQPYVRRGLCRQAFANPNESVGKAEEQIASIHLNVPGWRRSLAAFARNGGVSNRGLPLPPIPTNVLWGAQDRILQGKEKDESLSLLKEKVELVENCGHLPHLDQPELVAKRWDQF